MFFNPDEQEKTVKIPVQVRDGQIQLYFHGPLPKLKEGAIGDVVLPYYALRDPKARKLFSEERKIPLFKKKTLLYVLLRPEPDDADRFANHLLRPVKKASGNILNSSKKSLVEVNRSSLRSTISHSTRSAFLRQSNFRMFSTCNCEEPKRLR